MEQKAFESIIGYAEVKQELMRILDQLENPQKYAALGVTDSHGLLLHGAPGVGKSTFALGFLKASGRVAAELERYYTQVRKLLMENKNKLEALSARLVEEKTLLGDQIQQIVRCA